MHVLCKDVWELMASYIFQYLLTFLCVSESVFESYISLKPDPTVRMFYLGTRGDDGFLELL